MPISNGGYSIFQGMSLRTYIATKAMVAMMEQAGHQMIEGQTILELGSVGWFRDQVAKQLARRAYVIADEMMKAEAKMVKKEAASD